MGLKNFDPSVFKVAEPPCAKCKSKDMDFKLYTNFEGTGMDWVQWYCKKRDCGYYVNIEIV